MPQVVPVVVTARAFSCPCMQASDAETSQLLHESDSQAEQGPRQPSVEELWVPPLSKSQFVLLALSFQGLLTGILAILPGLTFLVVTPTPTPTHCDALLTPTPTHCNALLTPLNPYPGPDHSPPPARCRDGCIRILTRGKSTPSCGCRVLLGCKGWDSRLWPIFWRPRLLRRCDDRSDIIRGAYH